MAIELVEPVIHSQNSEFNATDSFWLLVLDRPLAILKMLFEVQKMFRVPDLRVIKW